jgi:hypothetical protein
MLPLLETLLKFQNQIYWENEMAKACKFCVRLNSFVCGTPDDCLNCGACHSKECKENANTKAV